MEVLIAIVALVAMIWVAYVVRCGGILSVAMLTIVAGSCFGHPFFHVNAGPIPLTSERVLIVLLVVAYAVGRLKGLWVDPKSLRKVDLLVAGMMTILVVSTFTHDWTIGRLQPLSRLVFLWLMPCALYWVSRQSVLDERGMRWIQVGLAMFGLYLSVTAYAETQFWTWMIYPRYISSPAFSEFLGRGRGPFLNPIGNGLFMTVGLAATMLCWPRAGIRGRVAIVLAVAIYSLGIYSTFTRSVWIGATITATALSIMLIPSRLRVASLGIATLVAVSLLATRWDSFLAFKRDKDADAATTLDSVKIRPILAYVAWQMFQDRPWVGCGYGQYPEVVKEYIYDRSTPLNLSRTRDYVPHNVLFGIATETGLLGLVPFLLMLGFWLSDCWHQVRSKSTPAWCRTHALLTATLIGAYLINGFFHDVTVIAMSNLLLFFFTGLSTGLAATHLGQPTPRLTRRRSGDQSSSTAPAAHSDSACLPTQAARQEPRPPDARLGGSLALPTHGSPASPSRRLVPTAKP